jgi:hypothetical protein
MQDMKMNKVVINKQGTVYKYDNSKYQSFKNRYENDPLYRSVHLARAKERLNCKLCNKVISRSNMSKHRRGQKCKLLSYRYNYSKVLKDISRV